MNAKKNIKPSEVIKRLETDGWVQRRGKGDHVNFNKPGHPVITVDAGANPIPIGTLRSIYRIAGWTW